jgi:hypothetical protein
LFEVFAGNRASMEILIFREKIRSKNLGRLERKIKKLLLFSKTCSFSKKGAAFCQQLELLKKRRRF